MMMMMMVMMMMMTMMKKMIECITRASLMQYSHHHTHTINYLSTIIYRVPLFKCLLELLTLQAQDIHHSIAASNVFGA